MRYNLRRTIGNGTGGKARAAAKSGTQKIPVWPLFVTHKTPYRKGKSASVITRIPIMWSWLDGRTGENGADSVN